MPVSPEPSRPHVQGSVLSNSSGLKTCFQRSLRTTVAVFTISALHTEPWLNLPGAFRVGRGSPSLGRPPPVLVSPALSCAPRASSVRLTALVQDRSLRPGSSQPVGKTGSLHRDSAQRIPNAAAHPGHGVHRSDPQRQHRPGCWRALRSDSGGDGEKSFLNSGHASKPWDLETVIGTFDMNCMDIPWVTQKGRRQQEILNETFHSPHGTFGGSSSKF